MPSGGPVTLAPLAGLPSIAEVRGRVRRRGIVPQQLGGDAVGTRLRDEVAEIRGLDCEGRTPPAVLAQALVRREEEQPAADDGAAERVAELVLLEVWDRRLENVPGREGVVLEIVGRAPAKVVGAALGDHLDLRAAVAPVHRREVVRDDAHFLDRFGVGRQVRDAAARDAVRARVVDGEGVGFVALAAGVDAGRGLAGKGVVAGAAGAEGGRHALAGHAGLQRDQVVEVPAVERHLLQLHAIDAPGHAALLRFDERRGGRDGHAFLHAGDFQGDVQPRGFTDPDGHGIPLCLEEPRLLDFDPIRARAEAEHTVHAVDGRRGLPRDVGRGVGDPDGRLRDHALLAVGDGPLNRAAELRAHGHRREERQEQEQHGQPKRLDVFHGTLLTHRSVPTARALAVWNRFYTRRLGVSSESASQRRAPARRRRLQRGSRQAAPLTRAAPPRGGIVYWRRLDPENLTQLVEGFGSQDG